MALSADYKGGYGFLQEPSTEKALFRSWPILPNCGVEKMGNSTSYLSKARPAGTKGGSKKHGDLSMGNDIPADIDEEERRPLYRRGRNACHALERQNRHTRFGKR